MDRRIRHDDVGHLNLKGLLDRQLDVEVLVRHIALDDEVADLRSGSRVSAVGLLTDYRNAGDDGRIAGRIDK